MEEEHVSSNPARDVLQIKTASLGYHSWTPEEVEKFERCHVIGTRPQLALALLLYMSSRATIPTTYSPRV